MLLVAIPFFQKDNKPWAALALLMMIAAIVGITYLAKSSERPVIQMTLSMIPDFNLRLHSNRPTFNTYTQGCMWVLIRCAASLAAVSVNVRFEDGGWIFVVAAFISGLVFLNLFEERHNGKSFGPLVAAAWWFVLLFCLVDFGSGDPKSDIELVLVAVEGMLSHFNHVLELDSYASKVR
jgi:hypothetical protein